MRRSCASFLGNMALWKRLLLLSVLLVVVLCLRWSTAEARLVFGAGERVVRCGFPALLAPSSTGVICLIKRFFTSFTGGDCAGDRACDMLGLGKETVSGQ